ncbi:MAG: diheme cytochrome c [Trichocoleus desertorum ATA4-8-CV12]|nr:diheme cytochrome c [Trichocoleus desertorum ATA4-8-CV12]
MSRSSQSTDTRESHPTPQKELNSKRRPRRRSPVILLVLVLLWSVALGWGLAQATETPQAAQLAQFTPSVENLTPAATPVGTVDPVPSKYQLGQELYLENCATCHIGLPPAILPTETWRQILQDRQHYGQQIKPLVDPPRLLVWDYLRTYSRVQDQEEETPYRIADSRYFKALHPRVELPRSLTMASCASCHPAAAQFNFRRLTPEWENSP